MSWYRVHNDILDNPKLLMLAPSDRWYFIAILSLKSQGVLDQFKGDRLRRVIVMKLRLTTDEWDECARRLQEENLIDKQFQPIGWEDRQFQASADGSGEKRYIYFIASEAGPIKIGYSKNPWSRLSELQTGSSEQLSVVATVRTTEHSEAHIHDLFCSTKVSGEWFSRSSELLFVINEIKARRLRRCCDVVKCVAKLRSSDVAATTDTDTDTDKPNSDLDKSRSGAAAPVLVDNSLGAIGQLYESENPAKAMFDTGVKFLAQYGHSERSARSFLGKSLKDHGESATVDAMAKAMIFEPVDPTAWIREVLQRADRATPLPMDWAPPEDWVAGATQAAENGSPGMPLDLIRKARDTFVVWFTHTGIPHHDWLAMFRRWCARDWERAQFNRSAYLSRLAAAGGFGEYVHFAT